MAGSPDTRLKKTYLGDKIEYRRKQKRRRRPSPEVVTGERYSRNLLKHSQILGLLEKLSKASLNNLIYPLLDDDRGDIYVLNLAEAQRLNLQGLRTALADNIAKLIRSSRLTTAGAIELRQLMREYCNSPFQYF